MVYADALFVDRYSCCQVLWIANTAVQARTTIGSVSVVRMQLQR